MSPFDAALAIDRVAVGAFFAISGYHKLFNEERHAALVETFKANNIPCVRLNEWFVPIVEFAAGTALAVGFLSVVSALLLGAICLVATCTDGIKRIRAFNPIDICDCIDDVLYLPEVLLGLMLLIVVICGPGAYSIDQYIREAVWHAIKAM